MASGTSPAEQSVVPADIVFLQGGLDGLHVPQQLKVFPTLLPRFHFDGTSILPFCGYGSCDFDLADGAPAVFYWFSRSLSGLAFSLQSL